MTEGGWKGVQGSHSGVRCYQFRGREAKFKNSVYAGKVLILFSPNLVRPQNHRLSGLEETSNSNPSIKVL